MGEEPERSPSDTKKFEMCQEYCDGNIATYYCPQCWTNYCEDCYDKEHKLKRRKEHHDKILTPRQVCPEHKLTLEYQNKLKNSFMCCMCVKEMAPGEFATNSVEPIDGIASAMKSKLEERITRVDSFSDSMRKKIEACDLNISASIENARDEVRRFFSALNLLLEKQEESFQHQLTNLLEGTQSKPVVREMKETLSAAENQVEQGKTLLAEDSLVVTRDFDGVVRSMDELLENKNIKNFVLPTLQISVNVHRHLLEMVRHPGFISSKFHGIFKDHDVNEKSNIRLHVERFQDQIPCNIYDVNNNDDNAKTFDQLSIPPRPMAICSPPLSLPEDENTPFSLIPEYSCNSSPLCIQRDETSSFQSFGANTADDQSLSDVNQDVCGCSEDERDPAGPSANETRPRPIRFHKPEKNLDSFRYTKSKKIRKRKLKQSNIFLSNHHHKTRRNQSCKELNICDEILTELWASEDSVPFAQPVDGKKIPRYYEIIKRPIDLSKMKTKLHSVSYDSVSDFVDDMKSMFDNCYQFNQANSVTFEIGKNLEKQFIKLLQERLPLIHYESSTSKKKSLLDESLDARWTGKQI